MGMIRMLSKLSFLRSIQKPQAKRMAMIANYFLELSILRPLYRLQTSLRTIKLKRILQNLNLIPIKISLPPKTRLPRGTQSKPPRKKKKQTKTKKTVKHLKKVQVFNRVPNSIHDLTSKPEK